MELETQKNQASDAKQERQRQLNVIYFVDASKTHSFRVPLKTGLWLTGALAGIVLWSFIGSFILLREALVANSQGERIRNLLDTVFQYQTRYDNVYDKAYPRDMHERKFPSDAEPDAVAEGDNPATQENEADIELAAKTAPKDQPDGVGSQNVAHVDFPVEIAEIKATWKPSLLQVTFNMRNNRKPDLSSGTLWGIATYQADGETAKRYVTAPLDIQLTEDGETASFRGGYRFSIRYFNSRTLLFPAPPVAGSFKVLRIFIADEKNNEILVSVPLEFSKERPNLSFAMPPHLKYRSPIRPTTASPTMAPPSQAPKTRPAAAQPEPKKNLTVPEQTADNSGNSKEQIEESNDEESTPVSTGKASAPAPAPAPPASEGETAEKPPADSMPTIIDDGPSE